MVSKAISDFSLRKQRQDQFDESMRMRQQTIDMSQQRLDYYINRDAEIRRENVQKREYEVASMFDQMTSSIGNNPTEGGIITEIQKAFVENETNNANKSIDNQQYVSTRVGLESRLRKMGGGIGQYVSFMKEMFSADPLTPGATFNISNLSKSNEEEQRMIDLLIPGNSQRGYDAKGDLYFDAKWNGVDVSIRYWATDLAPKLQQVDQAGRGLSLGYGEFDETLRANARNGKDVGDVSQIFSSTIIAGKDGNLTETWKNARSFVDDMDGYFSNRWITTILISEKSVINREDIRLKLLENNIESRPLWKPMNMQPVFLSYKSYINGVSEDLFKRGLCLPSGSIMQEKDLNRVVDIIKDLYES